ncbi:unnamed protein product [Auanema sp. JU1783]|nr:unnamed protein product [Auanema sp. JU1783]
MDKSDRAQAEANEHFQYVTGRMMYVQGDSESPLQSCIDFVASLVHYQLLHVLEKSEKHSIRKTKKTTLSLRSVLFVFRRNRLLLRRLLKLAETASSIQSLSKDGINSNESGSEAESEEEPDPIQNNKKFSGKLYKEISEALSFIALDVESETDPVMEQRQKRLAERVAHFDMDEYERFSAARACGFSNTTRGIKIMKKDMRTWLARSFDGSIEFVMAFLAKETVSCLVEDALAVREQEKSNWFKNEGNGNCLQQRHYEEALRRNLGYRYRGDILFGYF